MQEPNASAGTPAWLVQGALLALGIEDPRCHASTLCETRDGLATAFFGGRYGGTVDQGIWLTRQEAGRWAPAERVASPREVGTTLWNPVLHALPDGTLLLFYKEGRQCSSWWGLLQRSLDDGRTWGEAVRLPDHLLGPIRNKPVALADGGLLCGSSDESGPWRVHFERTPDAGVTWTRTPAVADAEGFGAIQPTLLLWSPHRWQAICRSGKGCLVETLSDDEGRTWSPLARTPLSNPNSSADAVILPDGRGFLVYNPTSLGRHMHDHRSVLAFALSADEGRTWRRAGTLEEQESMEFSYPAVVRTRDDLLQVTYTAGRGWEGIKHVVVDPARLPDRDP